MFHSFFPHVLEVTQSDYTKRTPQPLGSQALLQGLIVILSIYPSPICALAEFEVLLHKTKKMTSRELSRQTPDCIGAELLLTSTALCAYRNRHLGILMRCCEA